MSFLKKTMIGVGVVIGAVAVAYQLLLTDEAKKNVHNASLSLRSAYDGIKAAVEDITGIVMDETKDEYQSAEKTKEQWEALGY